jgi:hypothetical protein
MIMLSDSALLLLRRAAGALESPICFSFFWPGDSQRAIWILVYYQGIWWESKAYTLCSPLIRSFKLVGASTLYPESDLTPADRATGLQQPPL